MIISLSKEEEKIADDMFQAIVDSDFNKLNHALSKPTCRCLLEIPCPHAIKSDKIQAYNMGNGNLTPIFYSIACKNVYMLKYLLHLGVKNDLPI